MKTLAPSRLVCLGLLLLAAACKPAPAGPTGTPVGPYNFFPPAADLFLDSAWYVENQIKAADMWNGGLDGQSGMGAYRADFTGFFQVTLNRRWQAREDEPSTAVAQSRAIYMNVEAYRTVGPEAGQRFLQALTQGADFLLTHFKDPDYGGFYWMVTPAGEVLDDTKQGYGNVHPLLALAQAYTVTHDQEYLDAALEQLEIIKQHFLDPAYPGAFLPGFSRDFSAIEGNNNVDVFTHFFEPLLVLYDITSGEQQEEISRLIEQEADFLINTLYQDQAGYTDRGYVAYNYDNEWRPAQEPYTREAQWATSMQASTGHNIELAYLLSRAVERGFSPTWLVTARKLLVFCEAYAIDPHTGGMLYEVTDYEGKPLPDNPDNDYYLWWPQMETARALLHFAVVREWNTAAAFKKIETFIVTDMFDHEYGGLYMQVKPNSASTTSFEREFKGSVWKTNYHYNMFFTEAIRLSREYPDRVEQWNATFVPAP